MWKNNTNFEIKNKFEVKDSKKFIKIKLVERTLFTDRLHWKQ